jgi:thiol-disulfide isomerase/thioredoxin
VKFNRRTIVTNLIWVIAFLVVFFGVRAYQQRDIASGKAPVLSGKTLDGQLFSSETADKPVLVHFWASWCRICRFEQNSIDAIARDYPVITVAMQSGSNQEVARHLREQGLGFAVINDEYGDISRQFGVKVVPTTFIIDASGKIRFVEVGFSSEAGLRTRLWLARSGF